MSCPRCRSLIVTKDGTTQLGGQRFRCSQCGRRFTRRSSSAFSGRAFPDDIIALAVRWYVRYRLSYAEVSEWLAERGVLVDQSTIYRWVQRFLPLFGEAARKYRALLVPTGEWTRRTPESAAAGTTSIAPSTATARSWTPMCRRRATWLPRAGSSSGRSLPAARHHVGSSPTKPPPIRQPSLRRCLAFCIGPVGIARTASSATTGF